MNEWKRVFCSPKRLGCLLLLLILCLGLFVLSLVDRPDRISFDSLQHISAANDYAEGLIEAWRGKSYEEMARLADAEATRLENVYFWHFWQDPPFTSDAEAIAAVADIPDLADALQNGADDEFDQSYTAHEDAVLALRDEINYLSGYSDYLNGIQTRAEQQSKTSIFGKPGTFARRNLEQTAADFREILDVQPEFGNNRGIEKWLRFDLGDYFQLLAIILLVLAFLEERKQGLWHMIRSTHGGRGRLGISRIFILLAGSALATLLFSFLPLAVSMGMHGGWGDLNRPLQSLQSLSTCTLHITIWEWLLQFFAIKTLSGVLIGLLLWGLLGTVTNPQFSTAVLCLLLAGEYALYTLLPVQSILNGLKYFNIFAYIHTSALYTEYLNVNLFGFPFGIRTLALWGLVLFGALFIFWVLFSQSHRRPEGNRDILGKIASPINRALDAVRSRYSVGLWEGHKVLVFQYAVFLLLLVYLLCGNMIFLYSTGRTSDEWYDMYLTELQGPIDDSTDAYLQRARESAQSSENASHLNPALDRLEEQVTAARENAEKGGYEPWLVDEWYYDICYGPQSVSVQQMNGAVAILMIAILAAPLWTFDRQAGMTELLRSTKKGRKGLFRRKALAAALLAVFVCACVYVREVLAFAKFTPNLDALNAPVRNFPSLANFPLNITFQQYRILLYAIRLLMFVGVAETAMAIGLYCPTLHVSYVVCAAVLGLPSLLAAMGIEFFRWISPVVPTASAELLWGLGSGSMIHALPWAVWLAVSGAAIAISRRKWVKSTQ